MNRLELEFARKRKQKTKADMAAAIGKSVVSYAKKELGEVRFSDEEKVIIARELDLTGDQVNAIFLTVAYHVGKYMHSSNRRGNYTAEGR